MSPEPVKAAPADPEIGKPLPAGTFRRACRALDVSGSLELALLVSRDEEVASDYGADMSLAELVAERVRSTCDVSSSSAQIQYVSLGNADETMLLYVKGLGDHLLALVARCDRSLSSLRQLSDMLAKLLEVEEGEVNTPLMFAGDPASSWLPVEECTYAIAWRPVEPLPQSMRLIIRESVQRLARREGCQLNFIGVASDHVHIVLRCPSRRKGSWAAYALKTGIEQDIAQRYGMSGTMWRKGFLADPSGEPFGGEELLAYLSH